jgi:hypothetical protein
MTSDPFRSPASPIVSPMNGNGPQREPVQFDAIHGEMTCTPRPAFGSCELEPFGRQPSGVRGGHGPAEPTLLVPFDNRN